MAALARKVAHELNSPLDGVMRFVALAQRKVRERRYDDIERYLSDAEFGLQRMAEILRELTDVSTQTSKTALGDLLEQAARTLSPAAERHHVRLAWDPEAVPPLRVDTHLYQVLCNLLKNAIDAMPHGGTARVATRVEEPPDTACEPAEAHLVVEVRDTGPGIAPHHQQRLFEPFFTTKPEGLGTGLGLAVCREILLKLRGSITLRNREDAQGAVAVVRLPLRESEP